MVMGAVGFFAAVAHAGFQVPGFSALRVSCWPSDRDRHHRPGHRPCTALTRLERHGLCSSSGSPAASHGQRGITEIGD
jgi:hypothetical protein